MTRPTIAPSDVLAINAVLVASRQAVDAICDRWSLALVAAALGGERRFNGFIAATGIASRLLSSRLSALVAGGVLAPMPYSVRPLRYEYRLTPMGEGLLDVVLQMVRWEQAWADGRGDLTHTACDAPLRPEVRCRACGARAGARDILLKVSPVQLRQMPVKQSAHRRSTLSGVISRGPAMLLGPSLDIFGDKWGIEILLCAFSQIRRFNDIRLCTGIAANILSDRLQRLTDIGVLAPGHDAEAGYWLTPKGIDLYGVVVAIQDWADVWLPDRYRSPTRLIHRSCGQTFRPLTTCQACEQGIEPGSVRFPVLRLETRPASLARAPHAVGN